MKEKRSGLLETMARKQKLDEWIPGRNSEESPPECREDMRKLTVERSKGEAEGLRVSDTARVVVDGKVVSGAQSSEGEEGRCSVSGPGRFAEKQEYQYAERVGRHAGVRVVSAERDGRGHGREQGGVDFHSQCGEWFGWLV